MRSVIARYLGPTNTKGSRIVCIAPDSSRPVRKYYSYDHSFSLDEFMRIVAERFIKEELKWPPCVWHEGTLGNDTVFVSTNIAFRTK